MHVCTPASAMETHLGLHDVEGLEALPPGAREELRVVVEVGLGHGVRLVVHLDLDHLRLTGVQGFDINNRPSPAQGLGLR